MGKAVKKFTQGSEKPPGLPNAPPSTEHAESLLHVLLTTISQGMDNLSHF